MDVFLLKGELAQIDLIQPWPLSERNNTEYAMKTTVCKTIKQGRALHPLLFRGNRKHELHPYGAEHTAVYNPACYRRAAGAWVEWKQK